MGNSRSNSGGGFAGLLGLAAIVWVIWIIIKPFWWILGAAVLVGLFFLVRTIVRDSRGRADLSAAHRAAGAARADQQHNWALRGDDRGIYGPQGSELMHHLYPALDAPWRTGRRRGG